MCDNQCDDQCENEKLIKKRLDDFIKTLPPRRMKILKGMSPDEITERITPCYVKMGYHSLHAVLHRALDQAQSGKGAQRHGNGRPFEEQPIMEIAEMIGENFLLGQAIKKIKESINMDKDAAIRERLGAINYLAASVIKLQKEIMFEQDEMEDGLDGC